MALPVYAGAGAYIEGVGITASMPAPTGVDEGDIVLASLYVDTNLDTVTGLPTGWALAPASPVDGIANLNYLLWHRASGPESGPYVFTLSGSRFRAGRTHRITGCKATGTPWDVAASDARGTTNGTVTPPVGITTAGPDELVVWTATCWAGGPWTPPAGFTERQDSGFGHITLATADQPAAGPTGALTGVSVGNDKQTAWVSALLPVATAPVGSGPMNLADVMDEIAAKLAPTGLRVWAYPPGAVTPPAAIVSYPETMTFDLTYGRGMDRWKLPVVLVTGKATDRMTRTTLADYTDVSGVRSMKLAIEAGPHVAFDHVRVESCEFDVVTIGGVDYMAAIFDLDIAGSGV